MEYNEVDLYPIENPSIKFPKIIYAGFFERMVAFLIDMAVSKSIASIILNNFLRILGLSLGLKSYQLLSTLIILIYFSALTYFLDGQTLGKMIMGLKVVSLKHKDLEFMDVITREFFGRFFHLYSFFIVFYAITGITDEKQNLSDLMADTSVIKLKTLEAYEMDPNKNYEDNLK